MKKGQIEMVALVIALVIVIGGMTYGAITIAQDNKYVGNIDTKLVYDTTKCEIEFQNKIKFKSLEEAHSLGFQNAPNCT